MHKEEVQSETLSIFRLSKEYFAVDAKRVIEIVVAPQVTSVPKAAEYMTGLFNHRGRILSLLDASNRLNLKSADAEGQMLVMVIQHVDANKELEFGIIVDEVVEVLEVPVEQIQDSPSLELSFDPSFVKGTINHDHKHVTLLNIKNAFAVK